MHQNRSHHHHGTAEGSFTAKKWFGHRAGRSPCAHSIGKFFLCYIVLFSSETSAPGSPGNYLYSKWLVTPMYKPFRPFGKQQKSYLGDLRSPWLRTTYKSWDDPPSNSPCLTNFSGNLGDCFIIFKNVTIKPPSHYMGVSKNNGTPKSSILIRFNTVFHYKPSILGYPYFWNIHIHYCILF